MNCVKALGILLVVSTMSQAGWGAEEEKPAWTGQVSVGWTSTSGNTSTDNKSLSVSAERRTEKGRLSGGADFAKGRQTNPATGVKITTEDWLRSLAKYDHFFTPKWYGFVNGRYETDKVALLDSRTLLGGGAGYQLIDRAETHLSAEAGLASQREEYATAPATSKSEVTAQLGYKFDHQIVETVKFVHDLSYFPSTEDVSDYYLTTTAEVRANFTKSMFGTFKTIFSRDASPAAGRGNSDVKYILGVGIGF